uniref:Uncharacterized protein n=1 Tax=Musa acuminata subsp. malaccensis TaxID=214687 RepID=A0A804JH89_MUSAM|nr:PREDICTED: uncharacterized protein At5g01610-like [Musa acuminata subsp. malaccensis]
MRMPGIDKTLTSVRNRPALLSMASEGRVYRSRARSGWSTPRRKAAEGSPPAHTLSPRDSPFQRATSGSEASPEGSSPITSDHRGSSAPSLSSSIEGGAKWLVNKLKGKMQKSLPELLREYDMPIGLFPQDATHYEFNEETGKLTVFIPSICEVGYRDSSVLRFLNIVTGYLEKGKLVDIEGIKTKVLIWSKVTRISTEGSKIHFTTGVKKTRSRDAYQVLRAGITVDKF